MGTRSDQPLRGLILHDERITTTNLDATNSSYSQSTGRPGVSVPADGKSRLVPIVSSEQVNKVTAQVMGAGMPEISAEGCAMVYHTGAETNASARGAISANVITGITTPKYTSGQDWESLDIDVIPSTQQPVIVVDGQTHQFGTIGTDGLWDLFTVSGDGAMAVCVIPETERVLIFSDGASTHEPKIDYTDDQGTTIAEYASGVLDTDPTTTPVEARMVHHKGNISLLTTGASSTMTQYYSDNEGTRFQKVDDMTANDVNLLSGPNGMLHLVYRLSTDDKVYIKTISEASQSFNDATAVEVSSLTTIDGSCGAAVDHDGTIYIYAVSDASNSEAANGDVLTWFSVDNGATFTLFLRGPFSPGVAGAAYPANMGCVAAGGSILMLCNFAGTGVPATFNDAAYCIRFGGWSNKTNGYVSSVETLRQRASFGREMVSSPMEAQTWIPALVPDSAGWTKASSTITSALSGGGLVINSAAATGTLTYTENALGGSNDNLSLMCDMKTLSGGSVSSDQIGFQMQRSNGSRYWDISVRMSASQVRIVDNNASSTLATSSVTTTDAHQYLCFIYSVVASDTAWVWLYHRKSQDSNQQPESVWTAITEGTALTSSASGPPAENTVVWGQAASSSASSAWRLMQVAEGDTMGVGGVAGWDDGSGTEYFKTNGRPLTALPYPAPAIGTANSNMGFLSARGGPARLGETFTIDADHEYSISNIMPTESPSPDRTWRSTDKSEQQIVFDLTDSTLLGHADAIGFHMSNTNFSECTLAGSNNASVWTNLVTWNSQLPDNGTGPRGTITGKTVEPLNGYTAGYVKRYIQQNELAGGIFKDNASTVNIEGNGAGVWNGNTSKRASLRCDAAPTGTTDVKIYAPRGVTVVNSTAVSMPKYRYYRLLIPASAVCADSYFEIGSMVLGPLYVFGQQYARGWSQNMEPNSSTTVSRYGTTRTKKEGPPIRSWTMSWQDGVRLTNTRTETGDVDYLSVTASTTPIAAKEDVWTLLMGILEESKSGEIPVVALSTIPTETIASGSTITDRTLFLYGRLTGSVQFNQVQGSEDSNEFGRLESITVQEIV